MNAKTLEAIKKHGNSLLIAFANATEQDPVALCKKLRRIETATRRVMEDYCNGTTTEHDVDVASDKAIERVARLLGLNDDGVRAVGLFVNRDPRGCALKLSDTWTAAHNKIEYAKHQPATIYTDWGGDGLLAPNLNQ